MPTLPALLMMKFVAVDDPTTNWFEAAPATGFIAKVAKGEVEPTPTFPALLMMKLVAVDDPTTNWFTSPATGLMARRAKGDEVETPTYPFWFTPVTMKDGVELPWFETTKPGFKVPISTESLPQGEEVPMPTRPNGDERVETEKMGTFVEEVAIEKTLSWPFNTVVVERVG